MKIQVCRSCGNRNTVVSGALTSCNYCGSEDLEPISDTNQPNAVMGASVESSSNIGKWVVLLLLVLLIVGGVIFWFLQNSSHPSNENSTANSPIFANQTTKPTATNNTSATQNNSAAIQTVEPTTIVNAPKVVEKVEASSEKRLEIVVAEVAKEQEIVAKPSRITVEPKEVAQNLELEQRVEKQTAKVAVQPVIAELKPEPKPPVKPVVTSAVKKEPQIIKETKKTVEKKVERKNTESARASAMKEVASKQKESEDEKTIAELKRKLEEYKKQNLQSAEKKLAKETRLSMRVLDRQKGIVTDAKTGLMWMACSIGQEWNNGRCVGSAEEYLWTEAADIAKDAGYAGYSDWRLPTREELNTIVYCSNGRLAYQLGADGKMVIKDGEPQNGKCLGKFQKPTIDTRVFPNTVGGTYWSYSRNAHATYNAWAIFFNAGYQYNYNTTNLGLVRLVRKSR